MNTYMLFGLLAMIPTVFAYKRIIKLVTNPSSPVAPNLASWAVWTGVDASIFVSSAIAGVWLTMGTFGVYTAGCLTVIILVSRRGTMKWSPLEIGCLIISTVALIGWLMSGNPKVALYLNITAAMIGSLPTVFQSWETPYKEDLLVWKYLTVGGILNMGAVEKWDLLHGLAPAVVVALQIAIVTILIMRAPKQIVAKV